MKKNVLSWKAFFISIFLLISSLATFPQFKQIHLEKEDNVSVKKIDFYSPSEGYIAFTWSLGFSSDSGKTIIAKPIEASNVNFNGYNVNLTFGFQLSGVKAFDKNRLLAYGNYGLVPAILYSSDGGNTFKVVFHSQYRLIPDSYISDLAFENNNKIGYALEKHRILKTVDGGQSWTVCHTRENHSLTELKVFDESTIYTTKTLGMKLRFSSIDGGNTWENTFYNYNGGSNDDISCQSFLSENKIWMNTNTGKLLTSEDGGKTWILQNDLKNAPVYFSKINIVNDSTAYAIPKNEYDIYKTSNKGKIWEKLHRDNQFSHFGYSLVDVQILNSNIWIGGYHGYIALSNNLGGTTIPKAIFSLSETISEATSMATVTLSNFGRSGYKYQWFVNNKKISDSFNASYSTDVYGYNDTIKLIVSNALYSDTLKKITSFSRVVSITSFSPKSAITGQTLNIYGNHFKNITDVSLGGVPTKFSVTNNGSIIAIVGKGASGDIKVSSSKSSSTISGFNYVPPPKITSFSPENAKTGDTITLKGERLDKIDNLWFNNNVEAKFIKTSESELKAIVPSYRDPNGNIIIKSYSGSDTIQGFKVQHEITSVNTEKSHYNAQLYIYGSGFYGIESITLDGHPILSYSINSSTVLYITLGEGGTEGKLKIINKNGLSFTYSGLEYYQIPHINKITPAIAKPGDKITITGDNFRAKAEENFVYFGTVRGMVNTATKNSLNVTVPIGASYSPVTVSNSYTTSTSVKYFTPSIEKSFKINSNTFSSLNTGWAGNNTNALSIGDFNGDGKPDISVTEYGSAGNLNYFFINNNTPGKINVSRTKSVKLSSNSNDAGNGSIYSTVADWNHDGVLDVIYAGVIAIREYDTKLASYFRTNYTANFVGQVNSLGFSASFFYDPRNLPTGIVNNDMNQDGKTDFIVSGNYGSNYFPNIYLGDIDGDGKADVLVKNVDSLSIYRNISTKNKILYAAKKSFYIGATIKKVIIADFDNDEKLDIALGLSNSSGIEIWKNTSEVGNISITKSLSIPMNEDPTSMAVSDLNGDGKIDMAVGHDKKKVLIYENNTAQTIDFHNPISVNISALNDLAIADIDGDTLQDLIGLNDNTGDQGLQIMRNAIGTSQISSFYPTGGVKGTEIEIIGKNFSDIKKINIGGTPVASFHIKSDTTVAAILDQGDYGFISLETENGAGASSTTFNYLYKPQIMGQYIISDSYLIKPGDSVLLQINNYYMSGSFSDPLLKFQWFKDGKAIEHANKGFFIAKEYGEYSVQTSHGISISELSNIYEVRILYQLDRNNYNITVNNVACKGLSSGSINIQAIKDLNYQVSITGPVHKTQSFNSKTILNNLSAGNYKIRITIDGQTQYEQLYEVMVTEPKDFIVFSSINSQEKILNLKLQGSDIYYISINDKIQVASGDIKIRLQEELNKISISTDKACQGIFQDIVNFNEPMIYPNPVINFLKVNTTNFLSKEIIKYKIIDLNGSTILSNTLQINNNPITEIDITSLSKGIYLFSLFSEQNERIYKIIKE